MKAREFYVKKPFLSEILVDDEFCKSSFQYNGLHLDARLQEN